MYIEPNSNIKIYHNVPLDITYKHTLYFDNLAEQNTYFHGNVSILKYNLTAQSYQRVVKGSMRVAVKSDNLYDCNYLAFQNASFGTKWFYAFITGVEYVNNETSEITFEIDVMQTYLFDVTLKECFVEREHSATDNIGGNLIDEHLNFGEYKTNDQINSGVFGSTAINADGSFNGFYVAALTSQDVDTSSGVEITGNLGTAYSSIYSGLKIKVFNRMNTSGSSIGVNNWVNAMNNAGLFDSVVCMYMIPHNFFTSDTHIESFAISKNLGNIDGYVPKNKKLFTYPYNFLNVNNNQGNNAEYRYEDFSDTGVCNFHIAGSCMPNTQFMLIPRNYKGVSDNMCEPLTLGNLPQCAISGDYYKAWLAQNQAQLGVSLVGSAISAFGAGMSIGAGNVVGGVMGTLSSVHGASNLLAETHKAKVLPNHVSGNQSSSISYSLNYFDFTFNHVTIKAQFAKQIDDYFTMFGYATRRVKKPNRAVRPHWTFTKTSGCVLQGNAPADDIRKICDIYDNGITFWKTASEVGNYSLDNSPS